MIKSVFKRFFWDIWSHGGTGLWACNRSWTHLCLVYDSSSSRLKLCWAFKWYFAGQL